MPPLRVVLDTNVLVSALLYPAGALSWLRPAWQSSDLLPLTTKDTLRELWRVLGYPKFTLNDRNRADLIRPYARFCQMVVITQPPTVPECRDPNDQLFLELALAAAADALVTGDRDLLTLQPVFSIPIIPPAELRSRLTTSG